ncbi:MAG TPA: PAS domain-containing protein [Ohtaekwangia sp.]|uniref:PAS domain-containing protein n=1 Tax=Ohtaekwangia sp. TaxID=2066019 RepID=UPI002F95BC6D
MNISFFVRRNFHTIQAYEGIKAIRENLLEHTALVVQDEHHNHLGVLTTLDILQRPHTLVIDCLSIKPMLSLRTSVDEALLLMQQEQSEVLPVFQEDQFEGLVFKNDLLEFVRSKRQELEAEVNDRIHEIKNIHKQLELSRQVLQAMFDSTQSSIFLVAPDYRIIFFNKKALEVSRVMYGRELRLGDSILNYKLDNGDDVFTSFQINFEKALHSGEQVTTEREIVYPNMQLSNWVRSEYTPVYDHGKAIGVALRVVDITDRKLYELQIDMQTEILQQISWIQSHHTRQPVATILGLISILDKASMTEDNRKIIGMLEQTAHKLDGVIRETVIKANSI